MARDLWTHQLLVVTRTRKTNGTLTYEALASNYAVVQDLVQAAQDEVLPRHRAEQSGAPTSAIRQDEQAKDQRRAPGADAPPWVQLVGDAGELSIFRYPMPVPAASALVADYLNAQAAAALATNGDPGLVLAAFPNRSSKGQGIDSNGGGAGGDPIDLPTTAGQPTTLGRFRFTPPLPRRRRGSHAKNVTVAVLDSWPGVTEDAEGHPHYDPAAINWGANWLLQQMQPAFAPPTGREPIVFKLPEIITTDQTNMASHGLAVAGIINSIAPEVPVQVVRVLDDHIAGDVVAIFEGLRQLQQLGLLSPEHLLILNLSLEFQEAAVIASLPGHEAALLLRNLVNELAGEPTPVLTMSVQEIQTQWIDPLLAAGGDCYDLFLEALFWSVTRLAKVLIIAAAGNDRAGFGHQQPGEAAPASYGDSPLTSTLWRQPPVLGIGALGRETPYQFAAFSNDGDLVTLGGDANPATKEIIHGHSPNADSVIGVSATSPTGWTHWAGTSFAVPIVTGVAAALAARTPIDNVDDLRRMLEQHLVVEAVKADQRPDGRAINENRKVIRAKQSRKA